MKKLINNNKYILLIIAIAIYGFLFIEVKDSISSNNNVAITSTIKQEITSPNIEHELDPINYNYRNPFLKGKYRNNNKSNIAKNRNTGSINKKKLSIITESKRWLPISLKAIIRNNDENICIVFINSKEYLFNEMDTKLGYLVKKIDTNSITVSYNNEEKLITL